MTMDNIFTHFSLIIFFILFQLWQMQCTPFILSTYLTHRRNSGLISAGDQSMANLFWTNGVMYSWLAFPACMMTRNWIVFLSSQYASLDILWDKRTSIFYSKSEMEVTFSVSVITKYNNLLQHFGLLNLSLAQAENDLSSIIWDKRKKKFWDVLKHKKKAKLIRKKLLFYRGRG